MKLKVIYLTEFLKKKMQEYLELRPYAYKTKKVYLNNIDLLFKKYSKHGNNFLDKDRALKIINEKNPNKKVMLGLINEVSEHYELALPQFTFSKFKGTKKTEAEFQTYSIEEVKNIISVLPTKEAKLFFSLVYNIGAGLRVSEVINLTWNNFEWNKWDLDKNKPGEMVIGISKRSGISSYFVPPYLMNLLWKRSKKLGVYSEESKNPGFYSAFYPKSNSFIFPFKTVNMEGLYDLDKIKDPINRNKRIQIAYNQIRDKWIKNYVNEYLGFNKKLSKEEKGQSFKIHSLRHSRANQLLDEGVPIPIISQLLKHKRLETTMIYLKRRPSELEQYIKNTSNLMDN